MPTSAEAIRDYRGPALFQRGFRPLFLGAGVFAGIAMPLWLVALHSGWTPVPALDARAYHVHEMIFGYLSAVIAGFLLTAIPNWTGRLPVAGRGLLLLTVLWLAGRVAMAVSPVWPEGAAVVDAGFLVVFAAIVWREIVAGRNIRNLPVCVMVTLLALANIVRHSQSLNGGDTAWSERSALGVIAVMIALVGGRIVPSFTRNWMSKRRAPNLPAPFGAFDRAALGAAAVASAAWIVRPGHVVTGLLCGLAAAALLVRTVRWRGWRTLAEPLVWILHAGYLWLPVWFALTALAILAPCAIDASSALHALTAGAVGTMTIAVMTRAILGHGGRPLAAGRITTLIYLAVIAGGVLRVAAGSLPFDYLSAMTLAGLLWTTGFALFVLSYGPVCWNPSAGRAQV